MAFLSEQTHLRLCLHVLSQGLDLAQDIAHTADLFVSGQLNLLCEILLCLRHSRSGVRVDLEPLTFLVEIILYRLNLLLECVNGQRGSLVVFVVEVGEDESVSARHCRIKQNYALYLVRSFVDDVLDGVLHEYVDRIRVPSPMSVVSTLDLSRSLMVDVFIKHGRLVTLNHEICKVLRHKVVHGSLPHLQDFVVF